MLLYICVYNIAPAHNTTIVIVIVCVCAIMIYYSICLGLGGFKV